LVSVLDLIVFALIKYQKGQMTQTVAKKKGAFIVLNVILRQTIKQQYGSYSKEEHVQKALGVSYSV